MRETPKPQWPETPTLWRVLPQETQWTPSRSMKCYFRPHMHWADRGAQSMMEHHPKPLRSRTKSGIWWTTQCWGTQVEVEWGQDLGLTGITLMGLSSLPLSGRSVGVQPLWILPQRMYLLTSKSRSRKVWGWRKEENLLLRLHLHRLLKMIHSKTMINIVAVLVWRITTSW